MAIVWEQVKPIAFRNKKLGKQTAPVFPVYELPIFERRLKENLSSLSKEYQLHLNKVEELKSKWLTSLKNVSIITLIMRKVIFTLFEHVLFAVQIWNRSHK